MVVSAEVYPRIANVAAKCPWVRHVARLRRHTRPGIERTPALAIELQQFARTRLADYKRPRWVEFVDGLPTTATGKVQRFTLRQRAASSHRALA